MHHVFYRTIALRNTLQTLFAKLMISSDFTLILRVFLAECVCFLTYIDIGISSCHNLFQLKEKRMDSCGVSLGLSLDVLIYIIRYSKPKLKD